MSPTSRKRKSKDVSAIEYVYDCAQSVLMYTSPKPKQWNVTRRAVAIALTADGAPFDVTTKNETKKYRALAVKPLVSRSMRGKGLIEILIPPTHPSFRVFKAIPAPGVLNIDRDSFASVNRLMQQAIEGKLRIDEANKLVTHIIDIVVAGLPSARPIDPGVKEAMKMLEETPNCALTDIADKFGLSYYRMSHLFSESTGLPIRSFQVYQKNAKALVLFAAGHKLADVARMIGFSDKAHVCGAFQKAYGASPSYFFRNEHVKIIR